MPSTSPAESSSDGRDRIQIEIFENGTIMGAVVSEPNELQPLQTISESIDTSSAITLTSDMLNFNLSNSDSNSAVDCINSNNSSLSSAENCSVSLVAQHNMSSISEVLSHAECLNSSGTCPSNPADSNSRRNLKRSPSRRKSKKCRPGEIYVTPFPPLYAGLYVNGGSGSGDSQEAGSTAAPVATVLTQGGPFRNSDSYAVAVIERCDSEPELDLKTRCINACAHPPISILIGMLVFGGAIASLGGIVLGYLALVRQSPEYLSGTLLSIAKLPNVIFTGIGLSMFIIACALWRLSTPDDSDSSYQCFRPSFDTCRNCNSPYCANRFLTGAYFYPEFQHRQPPPSYMTSLQEYRRLVPERANTANSDLQRNQSPPPSYRSYSTLMLSASTNEPENSRCISENESNEGTTTENNNKENCES